MCYGCIAPGFQPGTAARLSQRLKAKVLGRHKQHALLYEYLEATKQIHKSRKRVPGLL